MSTNSTNSTQSKELKELNQFVTFLKELKNEGLLSVEENEDFSDVLSVSVKYSMYLDMYVKLRNLSLDRMTKLSSIVKNLS